MSNETSKASISMLARLLMMLNRNIFDKLAAKFQTEKHSKGFKSWTHLIQALLTSA
jgi:hypothetical protein